MWVGSGSLGSSLGYSHSICLRTGPEVWESLLGLSSGVSPRCAVGGIEGWGLLAALPGRHLLGGPRL